MGEAHYKWVGDHLGLVKIHKGNRNWGYKAAHKENTAKETMSIIISRNNKGNKHDYIEERGA